ncbi:MAG TPA: AMP-binding protein, partial [Pseudonocardiaceae bacterium]|nr:AMP-binding protein [Pseudonocardiaceae bacterium]
MLGDLPLAYQDRPALRTTSGVVSYGRLGRAATVVAARLAARGVRAGDLVPVLLPRSPALVATLLGVLRLGAGYAALDPRWPDQRIAVTGAALTAPVTVTDEPGRVDGDTWDPAGVFDEPAPVLDLPAVGPDAVSTVFFTSGSTGRPRGVLSTHRATDELFRPGGLPLRLDSTTVMAQAAPPSWDALTLELWGPLRNGGTSVLIDGDHLTPAALRHHIARDGLNTLWLTSSLFNLFVDEDIGSFAGSTQLAIGGER